MDINAAGILVINDLGELLVLHRKEFVPEGNRWGLPGGKVGVGQRPIDAAQVKTVQEVGLRFEEQQMSHLGEFRFVDGEGNDVIYHAWKVKLQVNQKPEIKLNLEGHDRYKWETPETLVKQQDLMVGMYPILRKYLQVENK